MKKAKAEQKDTREIIEALDILEKEKDIDKEMLIETIENALLQAYIQQYGTDNAKVTMNRETGELSVVAVYQVVDEVTDPTRELTVEQAQAKFPMKGYMAGDTAYLEVTPSDFCRIAASKGKQIIVQKLREEERKSLYNMYIEKEKDIVTGIVQRYIGRNIAINLGKTDATLPESEQIRRESFKPTDRIKVYVLEVKDTTKGPKITVSRTHPDLVKRLFENEVAEVSDGTVEIKAISREAGFRTKMAVYSHNRNVDAIGACVGVNGSRVNAVVDELHGEKIDIINWSEDPVVFIQNALSPARAVSVWVDEEERIAHVTCPDNQLSLAIGKEGQNARLAARLTGYKIDIKSESQYEEAMNAASEEELSEE